LSSSVAQWFRRNAPTASTRTQVLLAALMWTGVGVMLATIGLVWDVSGFHLWGVAFALPFVLVGLLKAGFILDKVAAKAIAHIEARPEGGFVLGFFSGKSWLLIAGMMIGGQVLRRTPIPKPWLGFLYVAVGAALIAASRTLWRGWSVWADRAVVPVIPPIVDCGAETLAP
jgi:hypothetical protein